MRGPSVGVLLMMGLMGCEAGDVASLEDQVRDLQSQVDTLQAAGATGPAGPEGPEGPQGPAGPPGMNGIDGLQGPEGPTGPQGPEGPVGPQGPQGIQGPTGPTGPAGADGLDGLDGLDGDPGPIGADAQLFSGIIRLIEVPVCPTDNGNYVDGPPCDFNTAVGEWCESDGGDAAIGNADPDGDGVYTPTQASSWNNCGAYEWFIRIE